MGARDLAGLTRAEYTRNPDAFRSAALQHLIPAAIEAVVHACRGTGPFQGKPPQRWAVRIALQVGGWLDQHAEIAVVLKLAQDYGLRGEDEIRARLDLAGKASSIGLEDAQARAIDLLGRIMTADPSRRETIREHLFGLDVSQSGAEVVEAKSLRHKPPRA